MNDLPLELQEEIFSLLDPETLQKAALVCKSLHDLAEDDAVGRKVYCRALGLQPTVTTELKNLKNTFFYNKKLTQIKNAQESPAMSYMMLQRENERDNSILNLFVDNMFDDVRTYNGESYKNKISPIKLWTIRNTFSRRLYQFKCPLKELNKLFAKKDVAGLLKSLVAVRNDIAWMTNDPDNILLGENFTSKVILILHTGTNKDHNLILQTPEHQRSYKLNECLQKRF